MISEATREAIDKMSYEDMLRLWRYEPIGSPWFSGEIAIYFSESMVSKRDALDPAERTAISKSVGFERSERRHG
jgi:hypothetical protein